MNVTVMGLGLFGGGAGVARFFAQRGARVTVTDMADAHKLAPSVESLSGLDITFHLGGHAEADFTSADLVVTNQAVRPDNRFLQAARAAGVPITTETGWALSRWPGRWAGVTGSAGKSTTSSLLAAMIAAHAPRSMFGGNIGGDLITRMTDVLPGTLLTVELSSFQLTWINSDMAQGSITPPHAAIVTNITPNHLDWHADMDEYVCAKRALLQHQHADDWAVLSAACPVSGAWTTRARRILCSAVRPAGPDVCHAQDGHIVLELDNRIAGRWPLTRYRLPGPHNLANALQACAAAYVMTNGDAAAVQTGLDTFAGLPHRMEPAGVHNGITFVNDSKSTTPEAAMTALGAVQGPLTLIAGGYDKHSPFDALAGAIQQRVDALVVLGVAGPRLLDAVRAAAPSRPADRAPLAITDVCGGSFEDAFAAAVSATPQGGTVLLSPACASWGMFVNYEQRGELFKNLARALTEKPA